MQTIKDLLLLVLSKTVLPFIIHHANRFAGEIYVGKNEFYKIKTKIIKSFGYLVGYDVQHIPGKKCWTCHGTGRHEKISMYPPFKVYDVVACWHCLGSGLYKDHKYVVLQIYKFGKYTFHNPLMSKTTVQDKAPFYVPPGTKIIKGYVEHSSTSHGAICISILFAMHGHKDIARKYFKEFLNDLFYPITKFKYKIRRLRSNGWKEFLLFIPTWPNRYFIKADGSLEEIDLPF